MTDIIVTIIIVLSFVSLVYLLLIMPRITRRPDMESFLERGIMFAHRGLHGGEIKENTLPAFERAVGHGYGIELDVQLSSDNIPVVSHDYTLKRVFGVNITVKALTAEALGEYGVPTLSEVLEKVGGRVPLIIEIKGEGEIDAVTTETCSILDGYTGPFCVEAFNPRVLTRLKKIRPDFIRGQLATNFLREKTRGHSPLAFFALQNLLTNFLAKPDFIAFDFRYKDMLSLYICKALYGVKTAAWTVRSSGDLEAAHGFDMVIFEGFEPEGDNDRRIEL